MRHLLKLCLALVASGGIITAAFGGPLSIAPTTIEFGPSQRNAVIQVQNDDDAPVDLQFRAYDWRQEDGADTLTPTRDLVVSPAIITVAAHTKQTFRVLRPLEPTAGGAERSYRLRLNQIPKALDKSVGVNIEFSIPVFVTNPNARPSLFWSARPGKISLENRGERRAKLQDLAIVFGNGKTYPLAVKGSQYLLTNARRTWDLPPSLALTADARIVATSDIGTFDATRIDPIP